VALCRTEPSVLRAAAMGLVALAALGSGSRAAGVRNLAVASTLLLLLDPFLSRSVGFTLIGSRLRRYSSGGPGAGL
jgi:competence protein ComEC